jgi:hypothetical protein
LSLPRLPFRHRGKAADHTDRSLSVNPRFPPHFHIGRRDAEFFSAGL